MAGVCLPAPAVGGDFYDWHRVGDEFQVVLADVMGKGIPAAIIGAGVRSLMRGASRFNDLETAVNRVAYSIEPDLSETSTFVTMLAARLAPRTGVLSYVDAGHGIAGIVTQQGKAEQFESDGLPLGAPAWEPWRVDQVQLEPGDTFVALSDGALDLFETIEEAREAIRETIVAATTPRSGGHRRRLQQGPPRHRRRHVRRAQEGRADAQAAADPRPGRAHPRSAPGTSGGAGCSRSTGPTGGSRCRWWWPRPIASSTPTSSASPCGA